MLDPSEFRDIVCGRRRDIAATMWRIGLRIVETPYTAAVRWRNRRYDLGRAAIHRASVPVVSVGNLTLGGTGKTPLVKWLTRWFASRGARVGLVSRGYGARHGRPNDEARELALALPDVPHVQNQNRIAAAQQVATEFACTLIVMDDGFQHRRLARDVDIVLLDALEPFGYEHVFPRGTLREPMSGLARAQIIGLSRADRLSADERFAIRRRAATVAPKAVWCELAHAASQLMNSAGETQPIDSLRQRRVAAFCGIGNPAGFQHTLSAIGCGTVAWLVFPDHHEYAADDLAAIHDAAAGARAELIVCTMKDLVKIEKLTLGELPLWAVTIEMQFLSGQPEVEAALERVLPSILATQPPAEPGA
jgi:tetraacyldisaccharide 4'-kinase